MDRFDKYLRKNMAEWAAHHIPPPEIRQQLILRAAASDSSLNSFHHTPPHQERCTSPPVENPNPTPVFNP
jgi:hypothetical protein